MHKDVNIPKHVLVELSSNENLDWYYEILENDKCYISII